MKGCKVISFIASAVLLASCSGREEYRLAVIAPGHFHAALLQKHMIDGVSDKVSVYAPAGKELDSYMETVASFNGRAGNPTCWRENVYSGDDFLSRLPVCRDGRGIVVLAGNNRDKADYILTAVEKGYNVLSDKPMCINLEGFGKLEKACAIAEEKGLVVYDMMTERHDIHNILVRELLADSTLCGHGRDSLRVRMGSIHYLYKNVAGKAVTRPEWYYDVRQQGEGIADVTVHLADLVLWQCFPSQALDYGQDVRLVSATRYPTEISREQFAMSTGASDFPVWLSDNVRDGRLMLMSNGDIGFKVGAVNACVSVRWDFAPENGGSDSSEAVYDTGDVRICLVQDQSTDFRKELYIYGCQEVVLGMAGRMCGRHTGMSYENVDGGVHILVPASAIAGHEEHFGMTAADFLKYCRDRDEMPEWETADLLCKYRLTTMAAESAKSADTAGMAYVAEMGDTGKTVEVAGTDASVKTTEAAGADDPSKTTEAAGTDDPAKTAGTL